MSATVWWLAGLVAQRMVVPSALFSTVTFSVPLLLFRFVTRLNRRRTRAQLHVQHGSKTVAFFHPYCDDGGGGERVLWRAVHALSKLSHEKNKKVHIIIYVGGDKAPSSEAILGKARDTFGIDLTTADTVPISFVFIKSRTLLEPNLYPVFTMVLQSIGAALVSVEALARATPDVFFDSTGWAFTYLPAKFAGCSIGCYVHYPTVSSDMLKRVRAQRPGFNNSNMISSSWLFSIVKVVYYYAYALVYCVMGTLPEVVMVNSKWTQGHIDKMWTWRKGHATVVYPPCNTEELQALPLESRQRLAVSIGQFRPEKDHELQLQAFAALKEKGNQYKDVKLALIGGCRNAADEAYVKKLKQTCSKLNLDSSVEFKLNVPHSELVSALGKASVGLHTMWNEHFGISVVEMMAAGVVTIAHNSGGPKSDILATNNHNSSTHKHLLGHLTNSNINNTDSSNSKTSAGYLATTPEEYADAMANVFGPVSSDKITAVREAGRLAAARFSDDVFDSAFANSFKSLLGIKR